MICCGATVHRRECLPLITLLCAGVFGLIQTAARAEPMATLTPGTYVKVVRDYDFHTDAFTDTPAKGEAEACFQITSIDAGGMHTALISGPYHPWWSSAEIPPGATDVWSNSPGYTENRPDAAPLELIRQIFAPVDGCAAR